MGNLFSVMQACDQAGLAASVTSSPREVMTADAVILPGVGAFQDAMGTLKRLNLASPLVEFAASGRPLAGVCLGMQLLMTESQEFGSYPGLGIIEGDVVRLEESRDGARRLKVPQVGWNRIFSGLQDARTGDGGPPFEWDGTPLEGLRDGEFMYFVHSFCARPVDPSVVLSTTRYGHAEFCSSLRLGNIFACQYHPERSGPRGLQIYHNLAAQLARSKSEEVHAGGSGS